MNSEIITFQNQARAFHTLSGALQRCPDCSGKWTRATTSLWTSAAKEVSTEAKERKIRLVTLEYKNLDRQEHGVSKSNEKKKSKCGLSTGDKVEGG